ncbi:MAG: M20/M25/M40 family metallo-hydrolase [Chloroflexota bacterium]|nr:M20/M25/M40 family metallo-hydrolase [Chloroflexota bacterium]
MFNIAELKRQACATIDLHKDDLIAIAKDILNNPESGFNEVRTSKLVADRMKAMDIPYETGLAITGVKGAIKAGKGPGPRVAIIGELDSLVVKEHPYADSITGAAHACGHHCQIGMMIGAITGLISPNVLQNLSGEIIPFAVPAEEFIEVTERLELRSQKKIEFLGGKQELIKIGAFDNVDIAMMCHTAGDMGEKKFAVGGTSNGHIVKYVEYKGRGSHAGGAPHLGINALNAASFALQAINANREIYMDEDTVRIHGIMTVGGEAVSAVPSDVRLEWRVRSSSPRAVVKNSSIVDRCFKSGALAVGASVKITNIPGYLPMKHDTILQSIFQDNASDLIGKSNVILIPSGKNRGGSTDMGDISQLIPSCHPYTSGAVGPGHSKDYLIKDYESAVITPAKLLAMATIDLLAEDGIKAQEVIQKHSSNMNKDSYLRFQRDLASLVEFDGAT